MAIGPSTRGSLRRPPSRTVDPLNPAAIIEDTEEEPVLASNASPTPVVTPEIATEPVAEFDSSAPAPTPARQRFVSLQKPPTNGRTAPTVVGPAQRAVAAAVDRTGADLPRPPAAPAPEQLDPVQPAPVIGMTRDEIRAATRQHSALQNEASRKLRETIQRGRQPETPVVDRSLRTTQPDTDESIAAENGLRVATGAGGGLFASHPELIRQAEAAEKVQDVPDGEGFEPIRNLFRGLAAGGLGLGESTGTILRYLGGETGLESVAAMGESIEGFFHPRMRAFSERAAQTFRADQNIFDNPELLLDPDFLTFSIGQIVPSLLATITPVGVGRAVVRKFALSSLAKKTAGAVGAVGAAAEEGRRVALTAKQLTALGKSAGKADSAGKFSQFVKIGDKAIDLTNPDVLAKLTRIGKAANAAGFAAGGVAGGALEGSSTYRETLDTLVEQGVPEDVARETAENAFLMMTAGSGVLNAIGLQRLFKAVPKLGSLDGIKARAVRGLQEALTEYLEGPLEAGIQLGQETITPEQAIQKMKDELNVAPAAFLTAFFLPGAGSQLGMASDNFKAPAQSAADSTQEGEPGELPDVDPGAGPAGQAVNTTTEEASATAQAEAEEVDETTVQEPDEGEAAAGTTKKTPAKPAAKKPAPSPAPEPVDEVVTDEDLVTEPELGPEEEGDVEPEPTPEELAFDEETAELTADDILNSRAALATDEDGEFEIRNRTKAQLQDMADEFGVNRSGTKTQLVVRITDQAQRDVEGLDVEETRDAQTIPDTEGQVQEAGAVTESVGGESSQDIQQPDGRAKRSKKADRKGSKPRAAEAKSKVKPKAAAKKPTAKTTKKKTGKVSQLLDARSVEEAFNDPSRVIKADELDLKVLDAEDMRQALRNAGQPFSGTKKGLKARILKLQVKKELLDASVTDLAEHKKKVQQEHDRVINEIRQRVTEEIQDGVTSARIEKVDPESIHKIGDRFVTDNGVRLEVKKYNRVDQDGTVHYDVEQTFQDGHKGKVTLNNKNLSFAEKMGGIEIVDDLFSADGGKQPSVRKDGRVRLTHFTQKENITEIDPKFHGTGIRGAEAERKRAFPDSYEDRIYFGLNVGETDGYKREAGLGPTALESSVDPSRLYDLQGDPQNLREGIPSGPEFINLYEQAIKEEGFAGYFAGNVAAVFETRAVEAENESTSERIKRISDESQDEDVQLEGEALFSADAAPQKFNVSEDKHAIDIMSVDEDTGRRISYMGAMKRGGTDLQIVGASVREPSQNQGIGQQLIIKMHELAKTRDLKLVSDTTVSTDQLRAYMGLRRKGWEIEFADEVQVKDILAKAHDDGTTHFLAMLTDSVVVSVRSPKEIEDELAFGTAQDVLFSADGGRGGTSERVSFTAEEKEKIEALVKTVPAGQEQATRALIRSDRQKFAPSQNWVRMEPTGVVLGTKGKAKGTVTSIKYKPIDYNFEKDPTTGKPFTKKKENQARMERRQKHLAGKVVEEVRKVEKAARRGTKWAKEILAQRAWYTAVTARLRNEFGGAADLIADLLGATSPKTPVAQNFTQTVDAARQLSEGKFDSEMKEFVEHVDNGGRPSQYKGQTVTKINGKKYGTNTISTMQAMAKVWRVVRPGQAPKARNFTGNLIGISDASTIDVWAARFITRMANLKRVPTKAEAAVKGTVGADGVRIGGAFGFAQGVFDIAAEELGMTAKDLQAVAWFMEKREWSNNKWTTEEGSGGSFEQQLDIADLSRVLAGVSVQKKRAPSDRFQNKVAIQIRKFFQSDSDSVSFRVASSLGLFQGKAERAFDVEATVTPDFNLDKFVAEMAALGKANKQESVFVSRVLSPTANNLNARPGIEVFFKNEGDLKAAQPILDSLVADKIDGLTMVVDPRSSQTRTRSEETFIGVRYQFVPEYMTWSDDFIADVRKRGMDVILEEARANLYTAAQTLMDLGAADIQIFNYDTVVIGQENYEEYSGRTRNQNQAAGRVWFGQPVAEAFEAAVSRDRQDDGAATPGGVRGSAQPTGAVDGGPDTTTQTTPARQSTAGQISATADNQLAGDASQVAPPARPASAAEGAAEQLSDPTADDVLFSADSRLSTVTDPKDRGKKPKTPLKADAVRFHLLEIINKISALVNVKIVQSHSDLPDSIQLRMKRENIETVRGVYMPTSNTLYIVADSAINLAGAERTMLHETFGHFAMSSMPSFNAIKARLQKIIDSKADPVINQLVKSVQAKGHVSGDQFLDEVLAEMSETMSSRNAAMKEVIALVKEMVRALGFNIEMSNTDMMALIRSSRRRIELRSLAAAGFGIDRNSEKYQDFLKSDNLKKLRNASNNQEIGVALESLSKEFNVALLSASAPMTTELDEEWAKKMNTPLRELSWRDRLKKSMQRWHDLSFDELTQGLIDSSNAQKVDEIRLYGEILDASVSSSKAMSTIRNMNNVMGAVMRHGIPALKENFIDLVDGTRVKGLNFTSPKDGKAFQEIWTPLQKIGGDSQLRNWEKWIVATRAGSIIADDLAKNRTGDARREKLIEQDLVNKTLQWARDRTADNGQTYEEVFKEVQANWQEVNKDNLDLAEKTGVIDKAERAIWDQYDYVPFWREMTAMESGHASGRSSRTDVSSAGLFRLTGGTDRDGSPNRLEGNVVDSMFMNTAYLLERSYKNEAMRRTKDVGVQTGSMTKEPQVAKPQRIPDIKAADLIKMLYNSGIINAPTEEDAVAVYDAFPKAEKDRWATFFNRGKPRDPDIVTVMEKGKPVYYRVDDRLLLRSIVGMQGKNIGMWMSAMRTSKKWLTIGVTTDPAFMLANWMRDTVQTFVVSRAPLHSLADPIKSLAEAYNDSPAMLALAFAGRGGGGFYDTNPEKIRDLLKDMEVPGHELDGFMNTIVSPRKMFQWWKRVGTASEFANRVRVYNSLKLVWDRRIAELGPQGITGQDAINQAVREGLSSPEEAAFQAQDLLNFTRSGDFVAIQNLIQIIPFLNARVQGMNKLWRGAKESPLAFATKGGALMAASLAIAIANDDDDRYNDLAEWDKDTYYHFWIQDQHWRLPKPFESGVLFSTIPERIWRAGKGIDGWDEFSRSMLHAALDTFAFNPIPQLVKPAFEQYMNINMFTSTPVIPAGMENLLPQRQYDWRTGEFARWVGDAMPDFMPDVMQSPKRIEHLMRGYFGAMGVYSMAVANVMTDSVLHGPERALGEISALRLHEMPVVKRFKQADVPHTTKYNRILWEQVREADSIARTIKKYQEEGEGQKALGLFRDEPGLFALRPRLRKIATQVSAVNKQINRIALDRRLSPERRAVLREKLLKQRNALTKQVEPLLEYL